MTRISTSINISSFTTDAKFRTWGSSISTSFTASGLVQTSDTGQINWTAVNKPTTTGTVAGYEVYRFNDSLQGTYPVYLKLEYGSAVLASGNSPNTWLSVGTGSDGAGNLTGVFISRQQASIGAFATPVVSNTAQTGLFTHTDGYFLAYQEGTASGSNYYTPLFFAIDRTRNQTTGATTGHGLLVMSAASNGATGLQSSMFHFNYELKTLISSVSGSFMPPGDSSAYGSYVFPVYGTYPEPLIQAGFVGHMVGDITNYATFTLKPIGSSITHTYISLGSSTGLINPALYLANSFAGVANESNTRMAFLWED